MKFKVDGVRVGFLRVLATAAMAMLLMSCGGGDRVQPFSPSRILAFGDENSFIKGDGSKYTVNYINTMVTPNVQDCTLYPIWVQILANNYGMHFPQCNPTGATATSRILATEQSSSAAVKDQIDTFLLTDSFNGTDLVTVLSGARDVLTQYDLIKAGANEETASVVLDQAGAALAVQVNRVANLGGKVLISTIQDLGLSALAYQQNDNALLTRLSQRFNKQLRLGLINNGRMIGLLQLDEIILALSRTDGWVLAQAACLNPGRYTAITCTTQTLADDARFTTGVKPDPAVWVSADLIHLSAGPHSSLGSAAVTRAANNPF